jgi:hypothetical protein
VKKDSIGSRDSRQLCFVLRDQLDWMCFLYICVKTLSTIW